MVSASTPQARKRHNPHTAYTHRRNVDESSRTSGDVPVQSTDDVTSLGIGIYGAGESNRRKQGPELRLNRSIRTEQSTEKYREGPRATRASPLDSELGSEIARSI